jgi:hypothetical protein
MNLVAKFISARVLATLTLLALVAPMFAFAQAPGELTPVRDFLVRIVTFINGTLVPLVFALAFLVFIWGMFKTFILGGSDPGKQEEGKQLMLYAIVGFVIMVSLWGIVNLLADGFGFRQANIGTIPDVDLTNR